MKMSISADSGIVCEGTPKEMFELLQLHSEPNKKPSRDFLDALFCGVDFGQINEEK